MESGIIRRIDEIGRIAIPSAIRKSFGWTEGAPIEIVPQNGGVFLHLYGDNQRLDDLLKEIIAILEERGMDDCIGKMWKLYDELKENGELD